MIKNKILKNSAWIISCKIAQSIIGLVISILTARYLGPSNYGVISYAASIVAFVVPIMQLGLNNILVQELINAPQMEGKTLGTALTLSCVSSLLCMVGIFAVASIVNSGERNTITICCLYSIALFFQSVEMIQYWFQAKLLSKHTSITMLCSYVVVAMYKVFLLATGKSVYWFAISNSIDYAIIAAALLINYKEMGGQELSFSKDMAKKMLSRSKYYIVSSLMVTVFAQTDRIMLKLMIDDASVGYYTAAITIASMTSFVFAAIIDSFRPIIFENKINDDESYKKNITCLYSSIIFLSLIQSIFMTLFAKLIVGIMYGVSYNAAITALQIIVWYTTFSYMGAVRNIWILAENKQKYLWIINLSGALTNIILNFVLITSMGINGAALASLITQFCTNFVIGFVLTPIRANNALMVKGFSGKPLFDLIISRKNHGR